MRATLAKNAQTNAAADLAIPHAGGFKETTGHTELRTKTRTRWPALVATTRETEEGWGG